MLHFLCDPGSPGTTYKLATAIDKSYVRITGFNLRTNDTVLSGERNESSASAGWVPANAEEDIGIVHCQRPEAFNRRHPALLAALDAIVSPAVVFLAVCVLFW